MKISSPSALLIVLAVSAAACSPMRTARPTPAISPAPVQDVIFLVDTLRAEDIADIEIVKGGREGDLMGARLRRRMLDTLSQQQRRWEQSRPAEYRIRVVSISDCISINSRKGAKTWARSIVRDTLVVGREMEPEVERYSGHCLLEMRVDDLFRELAGALADTRAYVHDGIQYDPVYGFPRYYWISSWSGGNGGTLVETFIPAP